MPRRNLPLVSDINLLDRHIDRLRDKEERSDQKQDTRACEDESGSSTEVAGVYIVNIRDDEGREPCRECLHDNRNGHCLSSKSVAGEFRGNWPAETLHQAGLEGDEDIPRQMN